MPNLESKSEAVLAAELVKARIAFEAAATAGIVSGEFDGQVWIYKGVNLNFTRIGGHDQRVRTRDAFALQPIAGQVARCFVISTISAKPSPELMISRLNAFRWLAKTIKKDDVASWSELSKVQLNATVKALKETTAHATTYHRATALSGLIDYLNSIHARIGNEEIRFCERFIRWKHGIPNPIRSSLEPTSAGRESRAKKNYEPNLHIAIARARAKIHAEPWLEPSPGYDRIRLESLAFPMALGLRVGELCALPLNVLDKIEDSEQMVARIPTEKQALAAATAVPELWKDAVCNASVYLLEQCAPARQRAREIEESGFEFVRKTLASIREKVPLPEEKLAQLRVSGKNAKNHFFIDELTSAFSVAFKEFSVDGKFRKCQVALPRITAARMADWLDTRFSQWDWSEHSVAKPKLGRAKSISVADVGRLAGASKASVTKSRWFRVALSRMLDNMRNGGVFERNSEISTDRKDYWRKEWVEVRRVMLSRSGGGMCTAIDVDTLIMQLKERYAGYLAKHFKENFDSEGNSSGGGFVGGDVRAGVEKKLSEHLIVVWEYQFSGVASMGILPRPILRSDYYNYLSSNAQKRTVFERLGVLDDDGKPYSFTPHAIRRWVSTAVLRSGPSEIAIDLWMGRTPSQTRHYDYRTAKERAEYVRDRYIQEGSEPDDFLGRKVRLWRDQGLSDEQIEQLVTEKLKVLHFTPWGTCSRELYITPCNKGLVCLRGFGTGEACESFQIDPQDYEAMQATQGLRSKYSQMLQTIEPNRQLVAEAVEEELSTTEPLDQHISFILDVIRGCDSALKSYSVDGNG